MILAYTIRFSCRPDRVPWPQIILHIAFWLKYKMASICARLSNKWSGILDSLTLDTDNQDDGHRQNRHQRATKEHKMCIPFY